MADPAFSSDDQSQPQSTATDNFTGALQAITSMAYAPSVLRNMFYMAQPPAAAPATPSPPAWSEQPPANGNVLDNLGYLGRVAYHRPDVLARGLGQTAWDMATAPLNATRSGIDAVSRGDLNQATNDAMGVALSTGMGGAVGSRLAGDAGDLGAFAAYHGTPHDIPLDQGFKPEAIGTGEGAQAYGHGYYFAENPGVAKSYQDALSQGGKHGYNALGYYTELMDRAEKHPDFANLSPKDQKIVASFNNEYAIAANQHGNGMPVQEFMDWSRKQAQGGNGPYADYGGPDNLSAVEKVVRDATPSGKLYQVHLDVEPHELLDWDKPLSEQPEHVQKAIEPIRQSLWKEWQDANPTLSEPTHVGQVLAGKGPEASAALVKAGVHGVRYLDQGSRASGEGTHNIVMFPGTEGKIKITHVNGEPVASPADAPPRR